MDCGRDVKEFMAVAGQALPKELQPIVVPSHARAPLQTLQMELEYLGSTLAQIPTANEAERLTALRLRLVLEETAETAQAMLNEDPVAFADGLIDLIYVAVGGLIAFGIPPERVWDIVHEANMAKFPKCSECNGKGFRAPPPLRGGPVCDVCGGKKRMALRDEQGKVRKPEGWTPPDVASLIRSLPSAR